MSNNNSATHPATRRGLTRRLLRVLLVAMCLSCGVEAFGATLDVFADLDGDGRIDTASVANGSDAAIDIVSSHHPQPLRLDAATPLLGLIATDIDRDGDADLVALSRAGGVAVWINAGNGSFQPQRQPRPPTPLAPISSLDLRGISPPALAACVTRSRIDLDGVIAVSDASAAPRPTAALTRPLRAASSRLVVGATVTRGPPADLLR